MAKRSIGKRRNMSLSVYVSIGLTRCVPAGPAVKSRGVGPPPANAAVSFGHTTPPPLPPLETPPAPQARAGGGRPPANGDRSPWGAGEGRRPQGATRSPSPFGGRGRRLRPGRAPQQVAEKLCL